MQSTWYATGNDGLNCYTGLRLYDSTNRVVKACPSETHACRRKVTYNFKKQPIRAEFDCLSTSYADATVEELNDFSQSRIVRICRKDLCNEFQAELFRDEVDPNFGGVLRPKLREDTFTPSENKTKQLERQLNELRKSVEINSEFSDRGLSLNEEQEADADTRFGIKPPPKRNPARSVGRFGSLITWATGVLIIGIFLIFAICATIFVYR
ncbi:unnamed protein product [Notodromas monacha]|uniref:Uncharacterized protein n=1 Tax=Notodromas monacha TaxID=399045 RepID=A0A7R9GBX8_9CRUS|nr:unnamed protein product [Notodromas monacha]CAG0916998.1 unnamed protein product [Notodromas monacha]